MKLAAFLYVPEFLTAQCWDTYKKGSVPNSSLSHQDLSTEHQLVTERQTLEDFVGAKFYCPHALLMATSKFKLGTETV